MSALSIFLVVVWVLLGTLFLLQARRLELDPSKATDGTPPSRWRILGFVMLGLAVINVLAALIG